MQMQDEQLNILNDLKEVINYKLLNSFKVKVNEHIDFMLLNSRLSQVLILNDLISKIRFFFSALDSRSFNFNGQNITT